jgi:hypothetical protein
MQMSRPEDLLSPLFKSSSIDIVTGALLLRNDNAGLSSSTPFRVLRKRSPPNHARPCLTCSFLISGIYDDELSSNTLGSNEDNVRMVHEYLLFMFSSQLLQNTSVTPDQSTSRKRTRAPSESPSPPSSQPRGHQHKRGADAVSDVSDAIRGLSTALAESNKHPPTPERRKAAIQLLEDDGEFSDDEQVRIISLFASKSEAADSFLSIRKKRIRTAYIQSELTTIDL